jgi:hypothetical protein
MTRAQISGEPRGHGARRSAKHRRRDDSHTLKPIVEDQQALWNAFLSSNVEETWVLAERERIDEARAARLLLWSALGLCGRQHDHHPDIWSESRVSRLEQRRMGAA